MSRRTVPLLAALLLLAVACPLSAQTAGNGPSAKIEKIVLDGNDRLTQDAFLALTSLRPGESYDEERVRQEYDKIWNSGLLEDLSVEVQDGTTGKILTFHIKERPIVSSVEFTGSKSLTSTTMLDKLKENNADIKTGTVLDYQKVKKTESALRYMAAEKGFPDAVITSKVQTLGRSQVVLTFNIQEGAKARIDKVKFLGAHAYSQTKLRYVLKKTRPHWWLSWATRHDIYSENRYYEDMKALRELYEAGGYLDVEIGDPIVDSHYSKDKKKKWLTLSIPITEGPAFNLGDLAFDGNHVYTDAELRRLVFLKKGKPLNKVALQAIIKNVEAKYGEKGYIYATGTPLFDKKPAQKLANVTISITEDQVYYVNRIEFLGNLSTRDYVLRREMGIYEQQVFNYIRYQRGLYRLKQTALFEIKDDPTITKIPNTNTVNVTVKGTEASKNELLFGGGYGGVNGFFISGSFRTYNFLGMGTTLSFNADYGKVQKLYSINYSDPWLFGQRIGGAISLYNQNLTYIQFNQVALGGSLAVTFPIGDFAGWSVGYRHERSKVNNIQTLAGNPYYATYLNNSITSAIFGGISYNTVNNPFRPVRGLSVNLNASVAGNFLGGQNYFIKPGFEGSIFIPTFIKQNLAFRLGVGYITSYSGHDIPIWERFFLGGQDSLRGFGVRSVYPLTSDDRHFIDPQTLTIEGGNRYYLSNTEYVFHIVEQVDVAAFVDVGNTYHERQKWDLSNYRADAGVEVRFFLPTFNVPLRLIYAMNLKPRPNDDFSNFQLSIGLTF